MSKLTMKNTNRKTGLVAAIMLITGGAYGQMNFGALQDPLNSTNAAFGMPTYLGDGINGFQVNVFNPYVTVGSNFTNARDAREYISEDEISNSMINNTISKLRRKDNIIQGGFNVAILNAAFNLKNRDGNNVVSLGFGVNERVEMSTVFNRELFLLAYRGNKQFAGQTINLAPRLNALAYTEYYVSAAVNAKLPNSGVSIKPAIRLRYLSGQASISMPSTSTVSLYTEPDGRYLDFDLNYRINTSTAADTVSLATSSFNIDGSTFQQGAGSGFGMDLGLRVAPAENLSINFGITDIGGIRFRKNVVNMYNDTSYRYEGQELSFRDEQTLSLDSIAGIVEPRYSYNSYRMGLPTKLALSAGLGLGKSERRNSTYYRHNLTFAYLQGFSNYLSSTKKAYFAVGYTHSVKGVMNIGTNLSAGGVWGFGWGALVSFKLGPLRLGINTNNFLPLIASKTGKGSDVGFMLAVGN